MPEIGTFGLMSGDGKRGVAERPKLPRPSSTLPKRKSRRTTREHATLVHQLMRNPHCTRGLVGPAEQIIKLIRPNIRAT